MAVEAKTVSKKNVKEVTTHVVVDPGVEQIIIPVGMSKLDASIQLKKQHDEEETMTDVIIPFPKWASDDVTVAIMHTLKKVLGWVPSIPIRSFFGKQNPTEIEVVIGIKDGKEIKDLCFFGRFQIAQWDDGIADVGMNSNGVYIKFTIKKKFSDRARKFGEEVNEHLREKSIYKGKSVMIDSSKDGFTFIENKGADHIVLNEKEERIIQRLVIAPLGKYEKRCLLFTGTFGTGKTETAMRVGKAGTDKNITFIYCKDSSKFTKTLELATQYQPSIVFLEDLHLGPH